MKRYTLLMLVLVGAFITSAHNWPSRVYPHNVVYWDDLRVPLTAVNPPGQVSDPDFDSSDGLPIFDKAGTEVLFAVVQMPHGWKQGTSVEAHLHWSPTDAGDSGTVHWQIGYDVAAIGGAFAGSWTDLDCTDNAQGTDKQHLLAECASAIPMVYSSVSVMLKIEISRIGGTADTYDDDAKLYEFDLHYQLSAPGSRQESSY